jgi:TRAP-type C4-dicarboxylate transport system permease large subunit
VPISRVTVTLVRRGRASNPAHFGGVVVLNVVLGAITPPFDQLVFFVSSMTGIRAQKKIYEST